MMPKDLSPEMQLAINHLNHYGDRLVVALSDLEAEGGLRGLSGKISPKAIAKVVDQLRALRQAVDAVLAARSAPKPSGRPAAGPAAPHPAPPMPEPPTRPADLKAVRRALPVERYAMAGAQPKSNPGSI